MIGEILGDRYEILEKIGEGGMSIVYKARCNKLNRNVAVKILKSELSDNEEIVDKFKKEATSIATLSDNNIVNVLDVGTQDGINYIVMEYVNGKTLKELIKEFGSLRYDTTILIGLQIAKALECAHKNNIIHRDVKPQNILVMEDGLIKVTDFGIAKSSTSSTLTNTTTIMGSAHYFSPEQAKGTFLDARTDLYSLGVVLYEMVTGKLPFEGDSPVTIALKHIQETPTSPKEINSKIPDSLSKLIMKAMEKDPNKRYQTAREMISDLQKIKDDPNAIITNVVDDSNGHTIIMDPIVVPQESKNETINKNHEDDYNDYEESDDYYDDDEEDDDNENTGFNRKLIIGIVSVIAILIGLGVGAFFVFGSGSSDGNEVQVPNILGMNVDEAKAELEKIGLVYEEAGSEESNEPEGSIIDYSPKDTAVKKGSKVRVILSEGKEKVKMGDFTGETLESVQAFSKKHKLLEPVTTEAYSDTVEKGKIISTHPKAGEEINENTKISVVISKGQSNIKVPNVRGNKMLDAQAELEGVGLKVKLEYKVVYDEVSDGIVLSQTNVGESVGKGTTITITVGKYERPKEPEKIEIGKYLQKNMKYDAVMNALNSLGVKININPVGPRDGVLVDWDPKGDVYEGTTITLKFERKNTQKPGDSSESGDSDKDESSSKLENQTT